MITIIWQEWHITLIEGRFVHFYWQRLIEGGFAPFYWNGLIDGGFVPFYWKRSIEGDISLIWGKVYILHLIEHFHLSSWQVVEVFEKRIKLLSVFPPEVMAVQNFLPSRKQIFMIEKCDRWGSRKLWGPGPCVLGALGPAPALEPGSEAPPTPPSIQLRRAPVHPKPPVWPHKFRQNFWKGKFSDHHT